MMSQYCRVANFGLIQTHGSIYTDGETMARIVAAKRSKTPVGRRGPGKRAGWVRKNVLMDQHKLDAARRALGVDTETEAIDQALDLFSFREELAKGFAAVRRSGGIQDVVENRRRV